MQSNLGFRLMALEFKLRDWLKPPLRILKDAGVKPGMSVLDFGCGPGGFSLAAGRRVGPEGRVYAVDINPLARNSVRQAAEKHGLKNIQTILGDKLGEVPEASVDIALLYDVLHGLPEPRPVLVQLHRVLKPAGAISVSDHHLQDSELQALVSEGGFFQPAGRSRRTWQFRKSPASGEPK